MASEGSDPARRPTREDAWALLCEWTRTDPLRKHALAVEAAVEWYARNRFRVPEPDLDLWRAAGLLHDFDYERYPETHPVRGAEELRRLGYPEEVVEAVLGHGDHTGAPRTTDLARTVYACDEMSGFIIAVAYVRPGRDLEAVDVRSVEKKLRDRKFAAQVDRDQVRRGAEELGVPFDEHVRNVVAGLRSVRDVLGI